MVAARFREGPCGFEMMGDGHFPRPVYSCRCQSCSAPPTLYSFTLKSIRSSR